MLYSPSDAAKEALDLTVGIALFELRTGYPFPIDSLRGNVDALKSSLSDSFGSSADSFDLFEGRS